jgi:GT2 family glycosyltransferase
VFAWTDEWHRGDDEVTDWDFGLIDRARNPKPALSAATRAFESAPPLAPASSPLVTVIVCTYNGAATLEECLAGVFALEYPQFQVIVVDDGSTDNSAEIARRMGASVISTPNCGLSAARNTGLYAAYGAIVAYLDDDASPDPDWLTYLVHAFATTDHAAVGGPNIPPEDETGVASCVANAPGGPVQVLLSDTEAEHIPGCNMAFRRQALIGIGGFDTRFHTAGDDVDICWRLHDQGMTLGFHPSAMVWHRRRGSIRRFWRQQRGYGEAEALLERKWPEKYNAPGHSMWSGRLYGRGTAWLPRRSRVYHGTWGTAAFQPEFSIPASRLRQLTAAPEWYLVIGALAGITLLGRLWAPLLAAMPLLILAVLAAVGNAANGARRARFGAEGRRFGRRLMLRTITCALYLLQPAARLRGRLANGLAPWRRPERWEFTLPVPHTATVWSETWCSAEDRLRQIAGAAGANGTRVIIGGPTDRWDLEIRGGAVGAVRLRSVTEEHGQGRQLRRFKVRPRIPPALAPTVAALSAAGALAALAGSWVVAGLLIAVAVGLTVAMVCECGIATATALGAVTAPRERARPMLELVKECTR